jgi:hypothetical protein
MNSSSENVIRRNAGRKMMPRDDGWQGQCIRLQAKTHHDADYLILWREISFLHCWIFHIEMQAAGSFVSQRRHMRSIGIECKA